MEQKIKYRVGEILKLARDSGGSTRKLISERTELTAVTVNNVENGIFSLRSFCVYCLAVGLKDYEVLTIARNAPVSNLSSKARALSQLYWENKKNG